MAAAPAAELLECVINVSEGRDVGFLTAVDRAAGACLLDVHSDADHHRSVFTLAGPGEIVEEAARSVARLVVATLDLSRHDGAHPRLGTLDVVPWVGLRGWPVRDGSLQSAVEARDRFAIWAGRSLWSSDTRSQPSSIVICGRVSATLFRWA